MKQNIAKVIEPHIPIMTPTPILASLLMYATDGEDTTSNKLSGIEATKSTYLI
jgi:hypothetical protein